MKTRPLTDEEKAELDKAWNNYLADRKDSVGDSWRRYQNYMKVNNIVPTLAGYRKEL